jgi:hypothetical protein
MKNKLYIYIYIYALHINIEPMFVKSVVHNFLLGTLVDEHRSGSQRCELRHSVLNAEQLYTHSDCISCSELLPFLFF